MPYQGTHRSKKPLYRRLFVRGSVTLTVAAALVAPSLVTGTARASGVDCATATTPAATLTCAEQSFATAVNAIKSAQQTPAGVGGGGGVPVPVVIGQTSLLDSVDQTLAQAVQEANNCLTQSDPTCALLVRVANQEAQSIEAFATSCVNGTNTGCNQLVQFATSEINALVTLANECVGGSDPTCNQLVGTVSQLAGEAVACVVGSINPTAGPNVPLPNPIIVQIGTGGGGGGSGLPDPGVTCEQVRNAAVQLVAGCASGANADCGLAIGAVEKSPCLNGADAATCAQATVTPPESIPPDVDLNAAFPTNQLTGTIDTGSGVGVGSLQVDFYVDPVGSHISPYTPDLIGSTTTDSNGTYTFTLPSTLDAFATSQANANGGHLRVIIATSAYLTIPGTTSVALAIAQGSTSILIGGSADYFDGIPPTLTLYPAQTIDLRGKTGVAPPSVDVTDPSVPAESHYQGTLGSGGTVTTVNGVVSDFNPFIVNGVDFTNAVAEPPGNPTSTDNPGPNPPDPPGNDTCTQDDGRAQFVNGWLYKDAEKAYVIVGEIHAYADQTTGFTYGKTSDTTTQVGLSFDGDHWHVEGSANIHDTNSGFDWHWLNKGPYYGHQMRMLFEWDEWQDEWTCQFNRNKVYYTYQEVPARNTWQGAPGADVSRYDGASNFNKSNPNYRYKMTPGSGWDVAAGHGYGYGGAFSVEGFAAGAQTMRTQYITVSQDAGDKPFDHWVWGNNKYVPNGPQIVYSY